MMKKAICLLLSFVLALSCAACGGDAGKDTTEGTTSGTETYTVTVKSQADAPLAGVGVYIYTDESRNDLVWFARTDDQGSVSFDHEAAGNFVIVLENLPSGYQAEETYTVTGPVTEIVLETQMNQIGDLAGVTYSKGDVMGDFSVAAPDGTVYTLSELLAEKKIVVLNFWYLECQPCKSEFPYLQAVYEQYGDQFALLAMNPVNTDDAAITAFQSANGITFPMVRCDSAWENAMNLSAYPTTVVIDSAGTVSLIHAGVVSSAQEFADLLAGYIEISAPAETEPTEPETSEATEPATEPETEPTTKPAEKEEPTTAPSTEPEGVSPEEAAELMKDNPTDAGTSAFDLVVCPGYEAEVNIWRVMSKMYLTISDKDAYVIYNGTTYQAKNGKVSVTISANIPGSAVKIKVGNKGSKTKTFTVEFAMPKGSWSNPYSMSVNKEFEVKIDAGNDQGVYYSYTAAESGTLTLECLKATSGVSYSFEIQLQSTSATKLYSLEEGQTSITIEVKKGEQFMIHIGTYSDDNTYPAGTFTFLATLTSE